MTTQHAHIYKIPSSVTTAKLEFTPAIVSLRKLSNFWEVDISELKQQRRQDFIC